MWTRCALCVGARAYVSRSRASLVSWHRDIVCRIRHETKISLLRAPVVCRHPDAANHSGPAGLCPAHCTHTTLSPFNDALKTTREGSGLSYSPLRHLLDPSSCWLMAVTAAIAVCSLLTAIASSPSYHVRRCRVARIRHAARLRDRGWTVVDAGLDPGLVASARHECSADLARNLDGVADLGVDPIEQKYLFTEIATRHRLRWDFRPDAAGSFDELVETAVGVASPIIEALHLSLPPNPSDAWFFPISRHMRYFVTPSPSVAMTGAIISRPGAKAQRFHADAPDGHFGLAQLCPRHRLFNVFVPLVDIEEGVDGTMLWPGSHLESTRWVAPAAARAATPRNLPAARAQARARADAIFALPRPL